MSVTEDRARAAIRAIASTVDHAPPLALPQPGLAAGGPSRGRGRRWRSWAAPLAAAAVIVALALSLMLVKHLPGRGAGAAGLVPDISGAATSGPDGTPRYYVALRLLSPAGSDGASFGIEVGDSRTGKTLATFAPPDGTTFQGVSAAADDRTFAVLAVSGADPSFSQGTLTASWYKLVIAPDRTTPARLAKLPIRPWSWTASGNITAASSPGQVYASALSASGRELAVAGIPAVPAAGKPQNGQEVKVFSVATGQLLRDWTADDPTSRLVNPMSGSLAGVLTGTSPLTWIGGDRGLAVATASGQAVNVTGTVRRLNVAGPASGGLLADSTVLWSGLLNGGTRAGCYTQTNWPPLVSADGRSVACLGVNLADTVPGRVNFGTAPLAPGTSAAVTPALAYSAVIPPANVSGGVAAYVRWVSPDGGTMIVEVIPGGNLGPPRSARFMVVTHGRYTTLPIPLSMADSRVSAIAF